MTFFFVGSERMKTIYKKHEIELNTWADHYLDRIESSEDCKSLVLKPVKDVIEYQLGCVDIIVDYCGGNPFFMNLLCSEIFSRCFTEKRTYVSETDVRGVQSSLVMRIGETNFSHFWGDVPVLDEKERITARSRKLFGSYLHSPFRR